MPQQTGKKVIVTGGASGIGFQVARTMALKGADVLIAGRDKDKGSAAVAELRRLVPQASFSFGLLDLSNMASIASFAESALETRASLDHLFNVAGVMMIPKRTLTTDGFEMHMGTNFLGHFALTGRLFPAIEAAAGRVITVSARAASWYPLDIDDLQSQGDYRPMRTYALSKLADILFALELNQRAAATGVTSLAVDPGTAKNRLAAPRLAGSTPNGRGVDKPDRLPARSRRRHGDLRGNDGGGRRLYRADQNHPVLRIAGRNRLPKQANDEQLRRQLWQTAESLTSVRYPFKQESAS